MIDIHTHILPNMDDGSKSVQESYQLLNILEKQNVKLVALTSHFYPSDESIDDFLNRRDKSFKELNYSGNLELRLGSEVHFYRGISNSEDIDKLCIQGTNILLVELPFSYAVSQSVVDEIIQLNYNYQVVLAHVERYEIDDEYLDYLKNNGVLFQCNASFFLDNKLSKIALKWLNKGHIDFIGSDSHDLDVRKPKYKEAIDLIENKMSKEFLENFAKKQYKIISEK